jgi:acetolactate synthase-1/2/3 large subunit
MMVRVSDYLAQFVAAKGARHAYMLSGGGMMHLMDAVGRCPDLAYVCNHHEHACAVAAEGYARQSGELGFCLVTSGPGASNTVTGVVECWQDSVPVLFVSGQAKRSQTIQGTGMAGLRQFGTFEVDIVPIVQSITKYAAFVDDPATIRYHLEKACALAVSGRPGPVFLDIPVDVQGALIDPEALPGYEPEAKAAAQQPAPEVFDDLLDRLASARRPLILAGHGIRAAGERDAFLGLARALNVPVVTTQLAADLMAYEDALYVGHPGMKGDRPGNLAIQTADVILTLGASLHVLTTGYELDRFAPDAYKIQVDIDPKVLDREAVGVHQKLRCSVQDFVRGLSERLAQRVSGQATLVGDGAWHRHCAMLKRELAVSNEPHAVVDGKINYYDLVDALSVQANGSDTLVADAGSAFYVLGQAFRIQEGQRLIVSGALGAMGHALPLAIGASCVDAGRRVLCVVGDGSFQTNLQELATLAHHRFNLKLFVVNNDGYVSIRNTQNNFFGGFHVGTSGASGVTLPDHAKLAAAYDLPYIAVTERLKLGDAIAEALATPGPALCEIFTAAEQEILPTVSSYKREDGSMESKPIHDMYPFLSAEQLKRYMAVETQLL